MDITKFCAPSDIRHYLHKPMRHDGYIYATNGHIAVRIVDDPSIDAGPIYDKLRATLPAMMEANGVDRTWHKVLPVDTSAAKPCKTCGGTGRTVTCESCDGDGEFSHAGHVYHCKECDGIGEVGSSTEGAGAQCFDCNGSGLNLDESVQFDGVHIAARYLHLIGTEIPGAEIGISNDPTGIHLFRAPGVIGAVMPMRP